jgi:hypothetical protein
MKELNQDEAWKQRQIEAFNEVAKGYVLGEVRS